MLQPDANETNKVKNSSPGMTEGTEDQRLVCLRLTRDLQPTVAQELTMSYA